MKIYAIVFAFTVQAVLAQTGEGFAFRVQVVDSITGAPIPSASVVVQQDTPATFGRTDVGGMFTGRTASTGRYLLTVTRKGFRMIGAVPMGVPLNIEPSGENNATVKMLPLGVITGRVLDQYGDPVRNALVHGLQKAQAPGLGEYFQGFSSGTTDDRGEYRIADVAPGRYYVAAEYGSRVGALSGWPEIGGIVLFPDVTDVAGAQQVEVSASTAIRVNDLHLKMQRAVSITGHLKPAPEEGDLTLRHAGVSLGLNAFAIQGGRSEPDGSFAYHVLPGRYVLSASDRKGKTSKEVTIEALDKDVTGIKLTLDTSYEIVLLKPFAFPDPDRIVSFFVTTPEGPSYGGSATRFNVWRRQTQLFQDVSAYEYAGVTFLEQIHGIRVSADYFRLLGAPVIQGRTFTADEDRPNGGRVAILSYGLWQRRFAGDPRAIGKSILLNGAPHVVVGIVGPSFNTELDAPPEVWLPFQLDPASGDHARYFSVLGRLKPGVTLAMARSQLHVASDEFRYEFPNMLGAREGFGVQPYPEAIVSEVRSSLLVLAAAVSLVLLIACANVANLLLARATGRKREIALRAAVGASRGRIVRQLLTESVVLSVIGGALGLGLGLVGVRALVAMNPGDIPRIGEHGAAIALDWRLVLFAISVSLITGVLFGLIPALDVSRTDLSVALNESGGRSGTGFRQNKTRALLVISEVSLALVLLVGAALLIRSFAALRAVNPGFDAHNILTLRMSLGGSRFAKTAAVSQLIQDSVQRVESLPAVSSAAASYMLPLEGGFGIPFNIVGRTPASGRYDGGGWISVSPHYFDVFRIPVERGRAFQHGDDAAGAPVAIVNEAMARQFWPKGDPIGERVLLGKGYGPEFEEPERQIVGVAADVHDFGLNRNPTPMVYVPMAQVADGITVLANRASSIVWMVRTRVAPSSLRPAISKELEQASGGLPVSHVRTMDEIVSQSTARENFNMTLLTLFGTAALLLAVIGIYGLMAYSVRQRTREIGIRLALGAESRDVRNMVVMEGMRLTLIGVVVGIGAAFGLTRMLSSFLFGVRPVDPIVFVTVPILLGVAALGAIWFPARRAATTDPTEALRQNL